MYVTSKTKFKRPAYHWTSRVSRRTVDPNKFIVATIASSSTVRLTAALLASTVVLLSMTVASVTAVTGYNPRVLPYRGQHFDGNAEQSDRSNGLGRLPQTKHLPGLTKLSENTDRLSKEVLTEHELSAAASASGTKLHDGIVQRVPPSRPAPMYDKPMLRPTFDSSTNSKVLAAVGQTAYLHCRVKHLGDRVVTWIRKHDVRVLTVALFTYTTDARFTALHSEASNDWTLRIASPQVTDSGNYECQVSTEPSMSRNFQLQVVESRAQIDGPKEIHMMSGSNINLTCMVTGSPEPPQYIYWYAGTTLINYSERGGISVVTDKRTRTSRLVVSRATLADSGNYTCAPANAEPSSVSVYILNGEHPAAMQGGESTSTHCFTCYSTLSIAVFTWYSGFTYNAGGLGMSTLSLLAR